MQVFLPLLMLLVLLVLGIVITAFKFKNVLSMMKAMMISMSIGMIIGLDFGTILAMLYPDALFKVTVFSILVGAVTGFLSGLPFGIVPVLNGFLSGAMGGMMGTMLGSMFPPNYINDAVEIMAILSAVIIFLLFIMLQEEFKQQKQKWLHVIGKPEMAFLVIGLFLFVAHQTSFESANKFGHGSRHSGVHSMNIIVTATEYSFSPNEIHVKSGQNVLLMLKNDGKIKHEFEVEGTDIELYANPGQTEKISFSLNKPGTYNVVCDIPGHEEAGMVAKIIVK